MENRYDARGWLREAESALNGARLMARERHWVGVCREAQLCIEYSAKAVIDCFELHEWTHNPSGQLLRVVQANEENIRARFGEEMIQQLRALAADADEAAPWHGQATYGQRESDERTILPTDLCTQDEAERLLERAERSFLTASQFILNWLTP